MLNLNRRARGIVAGAVLGQMPVRPRGLIGSPRLESPPSNAEIKALLEELQGTFAAFQEARDEELKGIDKKFADVVQTEKVERINTELGDLQTAMNEVNAALKAIQAGGVGGDDDELAAEKRDHRTAFHKFFRKGVDAGLRDLEVKAAMSVDSDPDGGYVVPDQEEQTIDRVLATVSAMRQLARVVSISAAEYKKIVNTGGTGYGWVGEREARPATANAQLAALKFAAMELYANPYATQTLLDDARVDIGQWLADEVSIVFAEAEGAAFISGTGVDQPRGLLQYDTVADASWSWGNLGFTVTGVAADIVDASNNGTDALTSLVYTLKKGYRGNASFLMNRTLIGAVRKLKTIGDTAAYLWQPSVAAGEPPTLIGYPVVDDDNMPDVGAGAFPIAFGDFMRGYLIVDRAGIRVLRDPYTNKPYVLFYTTKRVGGGVQNYEAIKLLKCSA